MRKCRWIINESEFLRQDIDGGLYVSGAVAPDYFLFFLREKRTAACLIRRAVI